jgi:hypothetical protein
MPGSFLAIPAHLVIAETVVNPTRLLLAEVSLAEPNTIRLSAWQAMPDFLAYPTPPFTESSRQSKLNPCSDLADVKDGRAGAKKRLNCSRRAARAIFRRKS